MKLYQKNILDTYNIFEDTKGKTFVQAEDISNIFQYLDIEITPKHCEYMCLLLFGISNDLDQLEFKQIFNIFNSELIDQASFLKKLKSSSPSPDRFSDSSSPLYTENEFGKKSYNKKKSRLFKYKDLDKMNYFGLKILKKFIFYGEFEKNENFLSTFYINNWRINEKYEISGDFFAMSQKKPECIQGYYDPSNQNVDLTMNEYIFKGTFNEITKTINGQCNEMHFNLFNVERIWTFRLKQKSYVKENYTIGIIYFKNKNEINGKGTDDNGLFKLQGSIENDNFRMIKTHVTNGNKILFDGMIRGPAIQGSFNSPDETGQFLLSYQETYMDAEI